MKRLFILPLLICTSWVAGQFDVTRREKGDIFVWSGSSIDCTSFTGGTAVDNGAGGCECESGLTFSTENNQCITYLNEAYYRFGSNSKNPARCVYVTCNDNDMCIFTSPEDGAELQVSSPYNPMDSSDNCTVNFVDVIHDCVPRRVDLTLKFTSYVGNDKLYLQLERTTPLSYLEGELFKADVTCNNEYGNGKLFFKHNGTRNLLKKGSFDGIPAYDPSATSCTDVPTLTDIVFTSTHTASETSTNIMSWTAMPIQTITSHVQPTSNGRSDNGWHRTVGIAAGVSAAATIIIVILVVIICVMLRRRSKPKPEGGYWKIYHQDSGRKPTTQRNHPCAYGSEYVERT